METQYLNVDLVLHGGGDLGVIVTALEPVAFALHAERNFAAFELLRDAKSPETAIVRFCRLLEKMPRPARAKWRACRKRIFSIGVEAHPGPAAASYVLSSRTADLVARLGASIEFVVYCPHQALKRE